ncbi:MAG TPA: OmpA family protein [Allosphingosinicella sp.]|jgi:outer membrane protein OmpA-like peptidoglycan-associated protein
MVSLRLLGPLAAAAAVAQPSPPPNSDCFMGPFMVFFDWNDDRLTPSAGMILDNLLATRDACAREDRLTIQGHSDRSGSDAYNLALSRLRAERVRAYLAMRGVPAEAMSTVAHGERRPLVETPDGAQEPQNRHVLITFSRSTW